MGYTLAAPAKIVHHRQNSALDNMSKIYKATLKAPTVLTNGMWRDQDCFITAGGPSLKGFNFNLLAGKNTIGINKSFMDYSPTILYSMDTRFYRWIQTLYLDGYENKDFKNQWFAYTGLRIFLCPLGKESFNGEVYLIKRIIQKTLSFDIRQGIYGGNNSAFGALMLACALRPKRIFLLGYDMKADKHTHYHSGYPNQDIVDLRNRLCAYRELIEEFAPLLDRLGIKVINLNKDSAIRCFEFGDIMDYLEEK